MDRKSLDDILDGNDEPETTEAVEQPGPETQGVEPEPEGEPEGQPEAGPPPADTVPQDVYEPLKAVRSENKELKDQLEALRRAMPQQQEQKPAEPAPDIWENTEGWQSHFGGQVVNQAVQALSLRHISEPTRLLSISYAVFCLKKKKKKNKTKKNTRNNKKKYTNVR